MPTVRVAAVEYGPIPEFRSVYCPCLLGILIAADAIHFPPAICHLDALIPDNRWSIRACRAATLPGGFGIPPSRRSSAGSGGSGIRCLGQVLLTRRVGNRRRACCPATSIRVRPLYRWRVRCGRRPPPRPRSSSWSASTSTWPCRAWPTPMAGSSASLPLPSLGWLSMPRRGGGAGGSVLPSGGATRRPAAHAPAVAHRRQRRSDHRLRSLSEADARNWPVCSGL